MLVKDEMIFICENGAFVFDQGENIFCDVLSYGSVVKLIGIIRHIGYADSILCGVEAAYIENSIEEKNAVMYYARCEKVNDLLEAVKKDRIFRIAIFDTSDP